MELKAKTILQDEEYLRQVSKPVDFTKNDWQETIKILHEYCSSSDLILAIASVQLGIPLRVIYLKKTDLTRLEEDYNENKLIINPTIIKSEGLTTYWEACASCLNNAGLVERPYKIELKYYDIDGSQHQETFEGFSATVISHELDHLDGILHIDIAKKILELEPEERKELRKKEPYKIIRKTGKYIHPKSKDVK